MPDLLERSAVPGDVRLDIEAFRRACERWNLHNDGDIATAFGIDRLTVWRVRTRRMAPGNKFIGSTLKTLRDARFAELFEVVDYVPRKALEALLDLSAATDSADSA